MSKRIRMSITANPSACMPGLAMLTELARAGRDDLEDAIHALSQVVKKDQMPRAQDKHGVRIHAVSSWESGDLHVTTRCGRNAVRDLRWSGTDDLSRDVIEVTTTDGKESILMVTADSAQVDCAVCKKGLSNL